MDACLWLLTENVNTQIKKTPLKCPQLADYVTPWINSMFHIEYLNVNLLLLKLHYHMILPIH